MIESTGIMETQVHHPYSPSSLQNREACPCFENQNSNNIAAIAGTLQHSVAERGEDDHRLSDDEALRAAECMDFYERQRQLLDEARQQAREEWLKAVSPQLLSGPPLAEVIDLSEAYFPVDDCEFEEPMLNPETNQIENATIHSTTAGYVDRALVSWDRKHAILLDWKFGAWAVEDAQNNLQAIAYSLGIMKAYPTIETVKFYFKLPQLDMITSAIFTRYQIPELFLRVQTVVARAREAKILMRKNDFSMATPNVPVCNFCANLGRCTKVSNFACKVGAKFYPLEIPSDISPTGIKSDMDTALGLRLAQVMAVWAKAFRAQVTDRVICRGAPVPPGFKVQTRSDREIVDKKKFREVTLKYVTSEELMALATYTFGSVEDKIKDAAPRGGKKAAVEEYQKTLMDAGAVKLGDSYSFLKGVSEKS